MKFSIKIYCEIIIILFFIFSCKKNENINIAVISAAGDIMTHYDLQEYALSEKDNYFSLFKSTSVVFKNDDLSIGNLETPINDSLPISGYPRFNAKSLLLDSLKKCGFDVLSIANNHIMDQGFAGLKSTMCEIYKRGIIFAGAGYNKNDAIKPVFINVNNIKIGYISITSFLNTANDEKDTDAEYVNTAFFYNNNDKMLLDIIKCTKKNSDFVIVSFHTGNEYTQLPGERNKKIFRMIADNGADVILGHHPHVLQPLEIYLTKDNRKVLIAYSLGNFISAQARYNNIINKNDARVYDDINIKTAESIILQFDIIKMNNITFISSPRFYPIFNYSFIKKENNYYYCGYKIMFMNDLIDWDIMNESQGSNNLFKIKKIVNYRLSKIKQIINLPVAEYYDN